MTDQGGDHGCCSDGVVVTGMGAVTCCGVGVAALWDAVLAGRPGGVWLETDRGRWAACPVGVERFGIEDHAALRRQDRHVVLGAVAALEAAGQAGLRRDGGDGAGCDPGLGVVWGTSRGPMGVWEQVWGDAHAGRRPRPGLVPAGTLATGAGALSVLLGAGGAGMAVSAACASGAHAIATGAMLIRSGACDVVVAGASDAVLSGITMAQFEAAGLLAGGEDPARVCRPFDARRNGTVFGEGAGAVVLERESHARRRGAGVLARVLGWGLSADACGRIDPDPSGSGLERAVRASMAMAGVGAGGVVYVNLHGTGTRANDACEAGVMTRVFGGAGSGAGGCAGPWVGSTKGVTGHCVGATAAIEAIVAIEAIRRGIAPASANLEDPDPALDARFVVGDARAIGGGAAMSISAGFWGLNACLVFGG
ncbi:MAG: beta-ketoacyl-[acyl-carrier-protein] synthase family protein [Phycisphaerales bacterium]|nr:beta-ketoacyl-[acyl-carrier-protein] synthase family protein [Phycisphaerales bacterium]